MDYHYTALDLLVGFVVFTILFLVFQRVPLLRLWVPFFSMSGGLFFSHLFALWRWGKLRW